MDYLIDPKFECFSSHWANTNRISPKKWIQSCYNQSYNKFLLELLLSEGQSQTPGDTDLLDRAKCKRGQKAYVCLTRHLSPKKFENEFMIGLEFCLTYLNGLNSVGVRRGFRGLFLADKRRGLRGLYMTFVLSQTYISHYFHFLSLYVSS